MPRYKYSPGEQPLEGYTIEYALGCGGFGEVYFATSEIGHEVALKAILNHEAVELRGVKNCMNLQSSRLVSIYEVKRDEEGVLWVVMEYIRGPSLHELIAEFPNGLDVNQAVYLLRELSLGLTDLHNAGIVHRDLKPSNVFFENGKAKLGDFSLSKSLLAHDQTQHTMTVGSVHYMAPEISQGKYDKTVDIYALGVIFHEMLTGRLPHVGESVGEVLMKHLQCAPDLEGVDESFQPIILRAMARDPAERFSSAEEFAKATSKFTDPSTRFDSFCPATLSMIGKRSSEPSDAVPGETMEKRGTSNQIERPSVNRWELDLILAFGLILLLTFASILSDNRAGLGPIDGFLFALSTFIAGLLPAYWIRRWPYRSTRSGGDLLRRAGIAFGSTITLAASAATLTSIEFEGLAVTSLGAGLGFVLINWRKILPLQQHETFNWAGTLGAGFIAIVMCYVLHFREWWLFGATTCIGFTLPLQKLARRSPRVERMRVNHRRSAQRLALQNGN